MVRQKSLRPRNLWFERLMAIAATVYFGLAMFDLTYVHWRDLYEYHLPQITDIYDPVKGIEPHRETQRYLATVDELKQQISRWGLESKAALATLEKLRRLSREMIETNPFAGADKNGTLEKIKNRMRDRLGDDSAKQAFATFWSQEYLLQQGINQEITYFESQIRPLIATNYYRQIGESGDFIDWFWLIELPFVILFGSELLARSYYIKGRHPDLTWINAILLRWYDLFLLLPFWRWLRIIPVFMRLDQAWLLNLQPVKQQINQGIVANFAEELTQIVVLRVINQTQGAIKTGAVTRWLLQSKTVRPYVDVNNINEVEALAAILIQTTIHQVMPKIEPEIVALLRHNIEMALNNAPLYRSMQSVPGLGQMQNQLSEQLATQITTGLYNTLVSAVENPQAAKLSAKLVQRFSEVFVSEIQKKQIISEIQDLVFDLLEEIKLNYVQPLSESEIEQILEQTRHLQTHTAIKSLSASGAPLKSKEVR